MRNEEAGDRGDLELLIRWGALVVALMLGGLLLAARAADAYTSVFGFLLAGFGVLLGFRVMVRVAT